jgi:hypothetical protein
METTTPEELGTVLAALRHYQIAGLGDPANRTDALHDIATAGDTLISLDGEGIDALCERLNVRMHQEGHGRLPLHPSPRRRDSRRGSPIWFLNPPTIRWCTVHESTNFAYDHVLDRGAYVHGLRCLANLRSDKDCDEAGWVDFEANQAALDIANEHGAKYNEWVSCGGCQDPMRATELPEGGLCEGCQDESDADDPTHRVALLKLGTDLMVLEGWTPGRPWCLVTEGHAVRHLGIKTSPKCAVQHPRLWFATEPEALAFYESTCVHNNPPRECDVCLKALLARTVNVICPRCFKGVKELDAILVLRHRLCLSCISAEPVYTDHIDGDPQYDDDGELVHRPTKCGTCNRTWNDAIISSTTPVPSGRCPFESKHKETT